MNNYDFLKEYYKLQSGIMFDRLIDVGYGLLGYCKGDPSAFWNNLLTNRVLTEQQISETEIKFGELSRSSAIYFESTVDIKPLAELLGSKKYKLTNEDSLMFYDGAMIDKNFLDNVKQVISKDDLELFLKTFDACYQNGDPQNPYGELGAYLNVARDVWEKFQGTNRLEYFLAFKNGQPVAVSTLTNFGAIGYISNVGSLPEVRGEGYGKKATLYAVNKSMVNENKMHFLATEEGTYPNEFYKKIGFHTKFKAILYVKEV